MLVLKNIVLFSLLTLLFQQTTTSSKQELNDQLYEAVRKGDAAAVTSALDRGADVNAKFRYGTTALFKAAERGNADVAKVLLDRGADINVKDTFYGATPMSWALDGKHTSVVRLLLEKGAEGDNVLIAGTREGNQDLVKAALASPGIKPDTLTRALMMSSLDEKKAAITEMLKQAGAKPPHQVDAATLQSYAGKYKGDTGPEVTVTTKDGRLFVAGFTPNAQPLMALDKTTFRPINAGGFTFTFNVEGGKVVSMTFKQGQTTNQMKRVGDVTP